MKTGQKVIVTGGRDYKDYSTLDKYLTDLEPSLVIQGGAGGADRLAKQWCINTGTPYAQVDAHWTKLGMRAGPVRNLWMATLFGADLCLAFPGGKGTQNMMTTARLHLIPVIEVIHKAASSLQS